MTIFTDRCWANDKVIPTCDETHLYFSFHATKTNGSIVTKVKSKNNGVWYVNTETKEIRKICDMYFEDLFLCDDVLLGASGKSLYRIDVETGEIKKHTIYALEEFEKFVEECV